MPVQASEFLQRPLPLVEGSTSGIYYPVGASGTSTTLAAIPKAIAYFPSGTFRDSLKSPALQDVLAQISVEEIRTEQCHHLLTEGDVERASALYLLHPINVLLGDGLLPRLGIPAGRFECLGQRTIRESRPDIIYMVGGKSVLIVEYKHTNTLRDSDWTAGALITPRRSLEQVVGSLGRGDKSALLNNAVNLVRQGSKYSKECDLIVLFNYQDMIVLDFAPGGRKWDNLDNPMNYYFLSGENNGLTFRQLLLAAFIYGMRKVGLMANNA